MEPKSSLKGTQNRFKSAKMLFRTSPEWVWRLSLEKIASRTFSENLLCTENTAPAMLFTLLRGCSQARFGFHFGSILAPFWVPWAPKNRPRTEKKASQKNIEKYIAKDAPKPQKWPLKWADFSGKFVFFCLSESMFAPDGAQTPFLAPIWMKIC